METYINILREQLADQNPAYQDVATAFNNQVKREIKNNHTNFILEFNVTHNDIQQAMAEDNSDYLDQVETAINLWNVIHGLPARFTSKGYKTDLLKDNGKISYHVDVNLLDPSL